MRWLLPIAAVLLGGCAQTAIGLARHSAEGYMPRVHCVLGNEALINRLAVGGALGFIAYTAIFLVLVGYGWRYRARMKAEPWLTLGLVTSAAFFISCGIGHGIDVIVLAMPEYYHALSWVTAFMGVSSLVAAPVVLAVARRIHRLAQDHRETLAALKASSAESLQPLVAELVAGVEARVAEVESLATERMQALRVARLDNEADWLRGTRAQALMDAIPAPVCVPDVGASVFVAVNQSFADRLGYTTAELSGMAWRDLIVPEQELETRRAADEHQEAIDSGATDDARVFDITYISKAGERVRIVWDCGPPTEDGYAYYIGRT